LWSWCVFERVPPWDNSSAPLEDYPLAGFCCDPLYWEAIMRSDRKQGLPAEQVPVSAYGGSLKNLQDLKDSRGESQRPRHVPAKAAPQRDRKRGTHRKEGQVQFSRQPTGERAHRGPTLTSRLLPTKLITESSPLVQTPVPQSLVVPPREAQMAQPGRWQPETRPEKRGHLHPAHATPRLKAPTRSPYAGRPPRQTVST
jgi:hypothetical protein